MVVSRSGTDSSRSDSGGLWYHASCGENERQERHCVSRQIWPQPGQTPRVQNVFQEVPQDGRHIQRSSGAGRHSHCGQRISARAFMSVSQQSIAVWADAGLLDFRGEVPQSTLAGALIHMRAL